MAKDLSVDIVNSGQVEELRIIKLIEELVSIRDGSIQEVNFKLEALDERLKALELTALSSALDAAPSILALRAGDLQKRLVAAEAELKYYREWEDTREVRELVDENKQLKEQNQKLREELECLRLDAHISATKGDGS